MVKGKGSVRGVSYSTSVKENTSDGKTNFPSRPGGRTRGLRTQVFRNSPRCAILNEIKRARRRDPLMTLMMYILIGVIVVAAIFFIIKGKK